MGYLLYACYKQQRQDNHSLAGIDYVFSGLEFVPFSKRAEGRYDGQAWAYYGCLNLFANTNGKKDEEEKKKFAGRGEKEELGAASCTLTVHFHLLSPGSSFREIIIFHATS